MTKDTKFVWDQACQNAFDSIKELLKQLPVLIAPVRGKPLILYTSVATNSLGALLAQVNEAGKETALYYLSRTLMGVECNYSPIEKECLALIFAVQKLRHYCLSHDITLISRADPIKFLMAGPMLSGRLTKWMLLLSEYTISYRPAKAVKGQAVADFLAAHLVTESEEINDDFPDEQVMLAESQSPWQMYFDGACWNIKKYIVRSHKEIWFRDRASSIVVPRSHKQYSCPAVAQAQ